MLKLKLKKPLAFFDIESTGVNVASDRIVEIAILKINPDGSEEIKTKRINPTIPIPYEVSLIHGIYDKDVADAPTFKQIAQGLAQFLNNCDLAGYNSNKFDIPILMEEFLRAEVEFDISHCKLVDVQNIFHQMEQRTLKAAYKFYCNKELENAHSAEADILATYHVLLAQIEKYEQTDFKDKKGKVYKPVQNDIDALHKFSNIQQNVDFAGTMIYNEKGEEVFNFGKHKGKRVSDVFAQEPTYYDWMMNGVFPLYTKKKLTELRLRDFNKK